MKLLCLILFLPVFYLPGIAQQLPATDSVLSLSEVLVKAFEQSHSSNSVPVLKPIGGNGIDRGNNVSFVNILNTVAGVKMEERSPGSYRINIRGSALRSPFGVRNVKVYWNGIPVTDAGGNTYFNQFSPPDVAAIEIVKGPAGSMYGAGTGGLILMQSFAKSWQPSAGIEYSTGSYHLQNAIATIGFGNSGSKNLLSYTHSAANGYRYHSSNHKDKLSFGGQYQLNNKQSLMVSVLYCHLFYETPGGLNLQEYLADPRLARPAVAAFPSAKLAKAAIDQTSFLTGITHEYNFTKNFKNSMTLYGNVARIKNPTFRNYERRTEPGFGGRTVFSFEQSWNTTNLKWTGGAEWQRGFFNVQVSKNRAGNADSLQTDDDIVFTSGLVFAQADLELNSRWFITAGASINRSAVSFTRLNAYPVQEQQRDYGNQWAPRMALKKIFKNNHELFISISKGFSPPTTAELLPSTGVISTFLQPEWGTSYEAGGKLSLLHNRLSLYANAFYFRLNDALVLRKDNNNADYFVNAGNVQQQGIECSSSYFLSLSSHFIQYLSFRTAYTFSHFKYGDYNKAGKDLSGNKLPGVPVHSANVTLDILSKKDWYFNSSAFFNSRVFLNDENTAAGNSSFVAGCRLGWKHRFSNNKMVDIFAGVENLFNQRYSAGYDINAAGGRYYNAAPLRNYYAGIAFQIPTGNHSGAY